MENQDFKYCADVNIIRTDAIMLGFNLNPVYQSGSELLYLAPWRNDTKPSLSINIDKNVWVDHGTGAGGSNVDLLMKLYNTIDVKEVLYKFNNSYSLVLNAEGYLKEKGFKEKSKLVCSAKGNISDASLIRYLKSRGLSKQTWQPFLTELNITTDERSFKGIGFKNDSGGYEIRTPEYKFCSGKKDVSTITKGSKELVFFEGFMDFLSYVEMKKWHDQSIIVLNSTANAKHGVEHARNMFEKASVKAYLDNDKAGKKALLELKNGLVNPVDMSCEYAQYKDLNDQLRDKGNSNNRSKGMSM